MGHQARGKHRPVSPVQPRRSGPAVVAGAIGELMLTAGAVVLLFVVYTLWGTGIQTAQAQDQLLEDLQSELGADGGAVDKETTPPELELGDAYGIIRIPRFGDDWEWVIVEGVEDEDLKNGPGHYPNSVAPGEIGNFGVAAHRSGHGWPFADFPELRVGDIIEITTRQGTFLYELDNAPNGDSDGNKIANDETWVVDPVPGEPDGTEPTQRRITLTTCWPEVGSSHRMYATGLLIGAEL
ncbi:class E sortase [Jiangella rhizosphaerae]|uniref:Class E sortase n=1 Tax=Jiangella rhizosphaerae TaxID=2293569 RepID=A0A418KHV1_9ACTN|nr:class E sortase [Jiangella rhizosphaerae]RIQ11888.1 class E sortase [Jiangella rhizosphaerae]